MEQIPNYKFPEKINIEDKDWTLVDIQRARESAIYCKPDLYLRVGKPEKIEKDLALHENMVALGFPVAKIVSRGEYEGLVYFTEESLGDKHLGDSFAEDVSKEGRISEEHFAKFLSLSQTFAEAQIRTQTQDWSPDELGRGVLLERLCGESPNEAEIFRTRFSEVCERLKVFPGVVTHGDFNPHNIYAEGVIDLEDSFTAPAGYDLVSAVVHIEHFPKEGDYEIIGKYSFTTEQKTKYLEAMDAIYHSANLPAISEYEKDLEFLRAVWLVVGLERFPKFKKWRWDYFRSRFF